MSSRSSSPQRTSAQHPARAVAQKDLTDGDLTIGPLDVARSDSLVIAVRSESAETLSVSAEWQDADGNVYQQESASDLSLSSVKEGWARLTRKGPTVTVTVTDESGATENLVNVFVDTEP